MNNQKIAEMLFPNNKFTIEDIERKYPKRNLPEGAHVTRFAPSPTGFMHLGGFFQAMIDCNIAKRSGGVFYLRIEDTDQKREVEGASEIIINILKMYGYMPEEYQLADGTIVGEYGPYYQSERVEIYKAYAKKLVAEGKAFPCFCKKTEGIADVEEKRKEGQFEGKDPCREMSFEEIEKNLLEGKRFAIRLKSSGTGERRVKFIDGGKGEVEMPENTMDAILLKDNLIPTYHFAHAVDDTLMGTTAVVRGGEWLSSLPLHKELFDKLGFKQPRYIHTPLICKIDEDGNKRKISKRKDPEFDMRYYAEKGYPTAAVIEYLTNLINSSFEMWRAKNPLADIEEFPFDGFNITADMPIFDNVKFNDISKNIIVRQSGEQLYKNWLNWAKEYDQQLAGVLEGDPEKYIALCAMDRDGAAKPRKDVYNYSMMQEYFKYIFERPLTAIEETDKKDAKVFLAAYARSYKTASSNEEWFENVKKLAGELGYATDNKLYKANPEAYKGNVAKACEFIRIAITGAKNSPTLFTIMKILGEEEVKARLSI